MGVAAELVVTPALYNKVANMEFTMSNRENIQTGMHPFLFNQGSEVDREQAYALADQYDLVVGGHAAASLADTRQLLTADNVGFPRLASTARGMLKRSQCAWVK